MARKSVKKISVEDIKKTSPAKAKAVTETADKIKEANRPKMAGIAVCGSNPATINNAPFDDPGWLVYACSPHNLDIHSINGMVYEQDQRGRRRERHQRYLNGGKRPDGGIYRADEWFEIHMPSIADKTRPTSYLMELTKVDRVWMRDLDAMPYYKGARPFPEKELKERFSPFFFTSTIAFMLAKAIVDCETMGIPKIGIFGVMQASENEYAYQRPGIQYMIVEATKAGIQVLADQESRLFEPPVEDF